MLQGTAHFSFLPSFFFYSFLPPSNFLLRYRDTRTGLGTVARVHLPSTPRRRRCSCIVPPSNKTIVHAFPPNISRAGTAQIFCIIVATNHRQKKRRGYARRATRKYLTKHGHNISKSAYCTRTDVLALPLSFFLIISPYPSFCFSLSLSPPLSSPTCALLVAHRFLHHAQNTRLRNHTDKARRD